ncbi:KH domain-containing protein At4g18375-like isoform X2 [Punica granatum]|uniref:KH domain-containing protein At4g18375-like isoform X2 n=1 Tax=Punica granatum TaxID=22663 RepID=A0A6P8ELJ5_PUNGR|nr:KH domain-containing protein At4g18375-like isoform X2 [Punica granatum]
MVDSGKRPRPRDHEGDNKAFKRRATDRDEKGSDDLVVYRILCPDGVIGSVIGKSGKVINSIRQDTRAKVKVVDPFRGSKHRVITIYCYVKEKGSFDLDDDFDEEKPLCPAQDALLRVHSAIATSVASAFSESDNGKGRRDREECQILVPTSQSATIIGKAGTTIKRVRSKTRTHIKVTPKDSSDPSHSCAMDFDNFVVITGEPESVKKALFAVSAIMYRFSPKEDVPLDTTVPENPPSIIIPPDIPIYPPTGLYPSASDPLSSRAVPPILTSVPELQGFADAANPWPMYSSALPLVSGLGGSSRSEELIVRVLCPFDKIGRVIGKGGGTIKSIRQATGARIEVNDTKNDRDECIITVSSTESPDDLKSMAVEAVLMLQGKINDEDENTVSMRLLIPSKVIGCIIGKSGSIVSEIRKTTRADIRISKGKIPKCAEANDELVEVGGEVGNVRDALIQIVLRLRDDVLKEKDGNQNLSAGTDSLYAGGGTGLSLSSVLPPIPPPVAPLGYDQRAEAGSGLGMVSSSSLYGYGSLSMGDNGYGSMSSYTSKLFSGLEPPPSALEILVPANAVGKVIGKGGANIANIRKISGAMIEISDPKSSRGDRIAHIAGTPEQNRTAENLIQAFIMST